MSITNHQQAKYKAILVDFDGVLRLWGTSDGLIERKHGLPQGSITKAAFASELLEQAIRGIITDEQWRSAIAENLQNSQPDSDAAYSGQTGQ